MSNWNSSSSAKVHVIILTYNSKVLCFQPRIYSFQNHFSSCDQGSDKAMRLYTHQIIHQTIQTMKLDVLKLNFYIHPLLLGKIANSQTYNNDNIHTG